MKDRNQHWISLIVLSFILAAINPTAKAQSNFIGETEKNLKIGIFAPLYLDSLFNETGFKYGKNIPKALMPGIDFAQGALIALDSAKSFGANVDATIFDTKSYTQPISWLIRNKKLDSLNLIIGSVRDIEYKQLADFALLKNIPFISATYPNDGGITGNPFTAIMNSTLKAHCEAIYSYLLQSHGTDKLYLVTRKGAQEDKVAGYFKMLNEPDGKPLLNIQTLMYDSNFNSSLLMNKLDSNRQSVLIGGSLDESVALGISKACSETYESNKNLTLIGMPTWDGFASLKKKGEFETFPIYYTTPYFNNKWDANSKTVINGYTKRYKNKTPSDMAFRGYECTLLFTKILARYPSDFMSHLNDKNFKVFCEYNFRPVMTRKEATVPDYFENKHLYFVKVLNGSSTKAW